MQLQQTTFKDAIFGAEKEMNFSIDDDNPIIFDILRDKMYSNKIGSLCREVASNSRDANREAGRGDTAIEIEIVDANKLTFISDMCIVFRDFGIGISPDRMENVFVKYASSTKRSSNSQTGGFGLGAKTPFAYTDTFTVVTVCNHEGKRMKYQYSAMIDSSRKGKMIQFDSEETTESTGTQIIVPIKESDRSTFESECIRASILWPTKPTLTNFTRSFPELDTVIDESSFYVVKDYANHLGQESYVADVDGILYPIDKHSLGINDDGVGSNYKIVLKFPVGELTISANREAVQYDNNTKEKMLSIRVQVIDYLINKVNSYVKNSSSYLQACINVNKILDNNLNIGSDYEAEIVRFAVKRDDYGGSGILSSHRDVLITQATWNGKSLTKNIKMKHHVATLVSRPYSGGKVDYTPYATNKVTQTWLDNDIYYMDARKNIRRNITIWEKQTHTHAKAFLLIIPNSKSSDKEISEECMRLGFEYELPLKMYSDVEKAENNTVSSGGYAPSETVTMKVRILREYGGWKSDTIDFHRENQVTWNTNSDSQNTSKYAFVVVDKLSDTDYLPSIKPHDDVLASKLGGRTIIAINKQTHDRYVGKLDNMVDWLSLRPKLIATNIDKLKRAAINDRVKDVADTIPTVLKESFSHILPKTIQNYITHNKDVDQLPAIELGSIPFNKKGLQAKMQKVYTKYPMLKSFIDDKCNGYYWRTDSKVRRKNTEIIKNYIELVG